MNAKTDLVKLLSNFPNVSTAKDRKAFIDTNGLTKIAIKVDIEGNTIAFFNNLIDVIVKSEGADGLGIFFDNLIVCEWVGKDIIQKIEIIQNEIENLDSQQWWEQFGIAVDKPIITGCPYRDLFPFREQDARLFFGRETWGKELLKKVKSQSFVGIIGASGSGKSSLVFAGLIPQLRQEQNWQIVSFRPLFDPWVSLAMAFVSILEPQLREIERVWQIQEYRKLLKESGKIRYFVSRILEKNNGDRLLLFIDQFEEFYRSGLEKKEREEFLDELFLAVEPNPLEIRSNCAIAITLRADFLGYALDTPHVGDELQRDDLKLKRMNPQELRDAIEKPAQLAGAWLEKGLTERILEAVEEKSGSLPLLQFALTQLWHQQEDNRLTHAAYDRMGGLKKALPNYAEEIYGKLKSEQQKVKMVFLQLVHPRPEPEMEDTRRLATRDEVGDDNWDLAIRLASERLVVTGRDRATGEDTLEVVHEVLIQEWERLKQWIESERQYIVLRLDIEARAKKWRDRDRGKDYVLKGKELREAKRFQKDQGENFLLSDLAVLFIQASVKQQRKNMLTFVVVALVVPFMGTMVLGYRLRLIYLSGVIDDCQGKEYCADIKDSLEELNKLGQELGNFDLEGANLQGIELPGANFSKAERLSRVNFSGANLSGANFSGANLSGANFTKTNLSGADLSGAELGEVRLNGANLREANLSGAKLLGAELSGFGPLDLTDATGADLRGAFFYHADLSSVNFSDANLERAELGGADLSGSNFSRANLAAADLHGTICIWTKFFEADFRGAGLYGADFTRAHIRGAKNLTEEQLRTTQNWETVIWW